MLILLTNQLLQEISVNPDHIERTEPAGGESTDTKVFFFSRAEVRVKQSQAEIRVLCNPLIEVHSLGELQPAAQVGPSEFKSAAPETAQVAAEAFVEEFEKQRKRK